MNKKLRDISVIIVDDEEDWLKLVAKALVKEGAEVQILKSGDALFSLMEGFYSDVIVLDVMMPEKDGYQICSELKSDKSYSDIPVILLTSVADHVSSTRYSHGDGMATEADDYVPKDGDTIKNLVNAIIRLT